MKILVTGGAGLIGSHLVDRLIKLGHKVVVIDNLSSGRIENLNRKVIFYKLDVQDKKIKDIFEKEKPEIVFHLAAQINHRKSISSPLEDAKTNILGSLNVIQSAMEVGVLKFVFASSAAVYSDESPIPYKETDKISPLTPYGIAKMTVEKYLDFYGRFYNLDWISLRIGNVYGPRQRGDDESGVVAIFITRLLQDKEIVIFGSGNQTRDFIYVEDVIDAFLGVLNKNTKNLKERCFNIATQKGEKVINLLKLIAQYLKKEPLIIHKPPRKDEVFLSVLSIKKAKNFLDWYPKHSLKDGLLKTIKWYKANLKK